MEHILKTNLNFTTMSSCCHLITTTNKIVQASNETQEVHFLCALKRLRHEAKKTINEAFQRQTQISVAGYTCYYHTSQTVTCHECPKFELTKQYSLFDKLLHHHA